MTGESTEKVMLIAFDADDTLWQNEQFFRLTQDRFAGLLRDYTSPERLAERLLAAERRNLGRYGYGIKGFTLSMIEVALEVTEDRVPARIIRKLIEAGQDMLAHPIELLPGARDVLEHLAPLYRILLITKGDLLDQERKLAQSGLGDFFDAVEIVSEKDRATYGEIFARHRCRPDQVMMVGNSMRSDVLPVIAAGGWGIYVPHGLTWDLEKAPAPTGLARYAELQTLTGLIGFLGH